MASPVVRSREAAVRWLVVVGATLAALGALASSYSYQTVGLVNSLLIAAAVLGIAYVYRDDERLIRVAIALIIFAGLIGSLPFRAALDNVADTAASLATCVVIVILVRPALQRDRLSTGLRRMSGAGMAFMRRSRELVAEHFPSR
jgi:hypothetical protein